MERIKYTDGDLGEGADDPET